MSAVTLRELPVKWCPICKKKTEWIYDMCRICKSQILPNIDPAGKPIIIRGNI